MSRPRAVLSDELSPLGSTSIQSVERAVALLRLFLPNVASLGPTDIAQLSGMSVSTAHLLNTGNPELLFLGAVVLVAPTNFALTGSQAGYLPELFASAYRYSGVAMSRG